MRTFLFIAILFITYTGDVYAQTNPAFYLSKTIQADIADFTVDNAGNIYTLSHSNLLKKLGPNGDSLGVYNAVSRFGDVSLIDVTNPLKILLYYKDFATIVETDRFLNILNTIDLRALGIFQVKTIGLAYDNNIWLFDELDAQLKRIADDGTLISKTTDFRQLFDTIPDPSVIIDQTEFVYLYDTARGVYAFDHYGTLKSHVLIKNWQDFTVIDKSIIGRNNLFFFKYQLGKLDIAQEPLPEAYLNAVKIKVTPIAVYVLKKNMLEVYSQR